MGNLTPAEGLSGSNENKKRAWKGSREGVVRSPPLADLLAEIMLSSSSQHRISSSSGRSYSVISFFFFFSFLYCFRRWLTRAPTPFVASRTQLTSDPFIVLARVILMNLRGRHFRPLRHDPSGGRLGHFPNSLIVLLDTQQQTTTILTAAATSALALPNSYQRDSSTTTTIRTTVLNYDPFGLFFFFFFFLSFFLFPLKFEWSRRPYRRKQSMFFFWLAIYIGVARPARQEGKRGGKFLLLFLYSNASRDEYHGPPNTFRVTMFIYICIYIRISFFSNLFSFSLPLYIYFYFLKICIWKGKRK